VRRKIEGKRGRLGTDRRLKLLPFTLMARPRIIAPWLFLVIGLLSIGKALLDIYVPGFLSVSHLSNADRASMAPVQLVAGALWLVAGLGGLSKSRRNPEGKVDPVVRTIFGPQ
jgi:hypothetical protein